ncbi:pyridoxamine 5'-phosphate oxidase family protein [Oceanidesulfovibrio marinus]|uniref:Pyridoxamine 5'-phosphate oxidase family protein n=1 Tax=Oceanidesulfovibrio marinus TaxID=370038 RepID=A0A6P1ZHM5_9BACT|nr:pyridoxamine 5'-phosphate oxidase family protein [Oceanidesulfovibrio marinus]TVM33773.1 pyridoxamine 5'-phosphate oxidase family protein [Oceanidesulfovibrio marinus]
MSMRKKERAIEDKAQVEELLLRCEVIQLGLWDGEQPYVVAVNFGYKDGAIYFHSAPDGRKVECVQKNGMVSFVAIAEHAIVRADKACGFTTHFKSVSGFGRAALLADPAEKAKGLDAIMAHYDGPVGEYDEKVLERTAVVRIAVESMVGKINPTPGKDS